MSINLFALDIQRTNRDTHLEVWHEVCLLASLQLQSVKVWRYQYHDRFFELISAGNGPFLLMLHQKFPLRKGSAVPDSDNTMQANQWLTKNL